MKCSVCCTAEATAVKKDGNVYRVLCDWCADKTVVSGTNAVQIQKINIFFEELIYENFLFRKIQRTEWCINLR